MKLNRKQLISIMFVLFVLLVMGAYVFVRLSQMSLPVVQKNTISPFTKEEQTVVENIFSKKLTPLTKEDVAIGNKTLSSESATPLSSVEEAAVKRVLGR